MNEGEPKITSDTDGKAKAPTPREAAESPRIQIEKDASGSHGLWGLGTKDTQWKRRSFGSKQ